MFSDRIYSFRHLDIRFGTGGYRETTVYWNDGPKTLGRSCMLGSLPLTFDRTVAFRTSYGTSNEDLVTSKSKCIQLRLFSAEVECNGFWFKICISKREEVHSVVWLGLSHGLFKSPRVNDGSVQAPPCINGNVKAGFQNDERLVTLEAMVQLGFKELHWFVHLIQLFECLWPVLDRNRY
ncbi:hypothetical protein NPIL_259801 [Nephila pilipes]|uniref:Uncharacterized protein n=1 Tax=Nephila pilipes TaxID=299642 RepID=A0A8X6QZ37_NEPPI|nr:hypothetical protein NPIL_259801 [Nephila pilipes]